MGCCRRCLRSAAAFTTFYTTLPSAQANFSKTVTALRQADRMLLRSQDGQPASSFIGLRYPVSLALLSASLGTSTQTASIGASPTRDTPYRCRVRT